MAPLTTSMTSIIFLSLSTQINANRLLQQASCATMRCGLGGPCYDNPFTGASVCCPGDFTCSHTDYLSTDPVVCTDGNIYPNECYAYCAKQDPNQCAPHCALNECVSPITGDCSHLAPCPNRPYCQTDPGVDPFAPMLQLPWSSYFYIECKAYPHAQCRFSGCGGCYEYFVDSSGNIIHDCDADICTLPSDVGPCEAIMPRYYYNSKSEQCEAFTYGGCGGNANNFETASDCEAACRSPAVGDSCGVQGQDCMALGAPAALCPDGRTCYLNCGGCVYTNDANGDLLCSPQMLSQDVCPSIVPICGGFGTNCAEYNDGCNDCLCLEDGTEACTEKACAIDALTTPICTRCKPGYIFDATTNQCSACFCTMQFDPVCCDGNTQYSNACAAACQQATGCAPGPCAISPPVSCCDRALKPFCIEGSACCGDGTWSCSIGDGVTFGCGNIINDPHAFGVECEECEPLQCRDDMGRCITSTCLLDPCNDGNNGGCAQGETCSANNCVGPCKAICSPSISVGCDMNHCVSYNDGCNDCVCLENGSALCTKRLCLQLVSTTARCTSCAFGYGLNENNECVARRSERIKEMLYVRIH